MIKNYIFLILILLSYFNVFGQKTPKRIKSHKTYTKNNQVFNNNSIPLNGHYKIKYTDYLNKWKTEISYFKNGYRYGISKILRFNKLEKKGTYAQGLKHGEWRSYHHFNGKLYLTTHYKNGKKHGKEINELHALEKTICNYVNDSIDGPLITYDTFNGILKSKAFYKQGKKMYKHVYDDFLNIIEELQFSNKSPNISIERKKREHNNDIFIDSLFYRNNHPFKKTFYKNNKLIFTKEVFIKKDTTRTGKNSYVFIANFFDNNKNTLSVSMYYSNILLDPSSIYEIKNHTLNYASSSCDIYNSLLFFSALSYFNLYIERNNLKYQATYDADKNLNHCTLDPIYEPIRFRQSF